MKRVLASGVFDIVHPGHVWYLSEAKKLGDHLTVVVTSDGHATRTKRPPRHPAADRVAIVQSLKGVDEAFVGADPVDLAGTVQRAQADLIALGHDQTFDEAELGQTLQKAGLAVEIVRIPPRPGTTATTRDYPL